MYKKELILDKNFKEYLLEYCEVFGYEKRLVTRIINSLTSYNFIGVDETVFDFVSTHTRLDVNKTIAFHNMGGKSYDILLKAIDALGIPLKDEPGYKRLFVDYNKYLKKNKEEMVEQIKKEEQLVDLQYEFTVLKNQLKKNQEIISDLMLANRVLDNKIDFLINRVGVDLDGKKHR